MATGNFTLGGNGGINVIEVNNDFDYKDTVDNIMDELESKGYTLLDSRELDGDCTEVYKDSKLVAVLNITLGYYEHANVEVYLIAHMDDDSLQDYFEDLTFDYNADDGWVLDKSKFTRDKREASKVLKAVETFTTKIEVTARFSNGETMYAKV